MAILEIVSGIDSGVTHELKTRETMIGRHSECQIVLRNSTISRRHARIRQDGDHYVIDDMDSQHGTRVNGETVRLAARLRNGDEILLSQIRMVFRTSAEDDDIDDDRPSSIITSLDVLQAAGLKKDSQSAPKWRALLEITRALGVSLDLQEILPNVLQNIFQILSQASRGCILLADQADGRLRPYATKPSLGKKDAPPPISRTISESVMSQAKALLTSDAGADERFAASDSVLDLKMRSVMCAPLIGSSKVPFGMIHLDAQDPAAQFTSDDLDVLVNIANLVGQAVDHVRLHETQMEFARRELDMDTARQVQTHFLPQERPTIEGYQVFDFYEPTEHVGGDYFGYTWLPDGRLAIAVGDVAGHGVPAALLMARLCSEARYSLVTDIIPSEAIDSLNRELQKSLNSRTDELRVGDACFKTGDKVIQTRNNYDKNIFNGDFGRITGVDNRNNGVTAEFDRRAVNFERIDLYDLKLAYATSIHKSQGSEFPIVVIPILKQHFVMLQRNLLYTAITRGRSRLFVDGEIAAWAMAVRNSDSAVRRTGLRERIRHLAPPA